jgi:hypothetical protein
LYTEQPKAAKKEGCKNMDKFWLESYEAGVPAEIDWTQYRSLTHLLEEAFHKYADRNAYACMGKSMSFANSTSCRHADGGLAAKPRPAAGRARGDHAAERAAVSGGDGAVLRAGYTIVNVNPLYTAARAAAPAERLGRRSHRRAGELRPHGGRGGRPRPRSSTSSSAAWATCWARRA